MDSDSQFICESTTSTVSMFIETAKSVANGQKSGYDGIEVLVAKAPVDQ